MNKITSFDLGYMAYYQNYRIDDNPYLRSDNNYYRWSDGYINCFLNESKKYV